MTAKVVILNWNGEKHLRNFLPSVAYTVPPDVGIVVVDNASTDNSVKVLEEEFASVEIVRLDKNYGFAKGYNLGLEKVDADCYILLNSDVQTSPGWVKPLLELLRNDVQLMAVSPKILSYTDKSMFEYAGAAGGFIDKYGYPFCRGRILSTIEKDNGQYDSQRDVFWASGACMACRRELFTEVGGFDDDFFAHMEEIDLCWRAQLYGYAIAVEPRSVVYHLGGGTLPNNSPRKIYFNYRNSLYMLYKNLPVGGKGWILFSRKVLDGLSAAAYLFTGRFAFFWQVFRAHIDYHKNIKHFRIKRKEVQMRATALPRHIYRKSILTRYFLKGKHTFGDMM